MVGYNKVVNRVKQLPKVIKFEYIFDRHFVANVE